MSAPAGALALAATLSPAATGALPPAGAAGDPAVRPFDGLLAEAEAGGSDATTPDALAAPAGGESAAAMPAPVPVDATQAAAPAAATAPPAMDDPATAAVLNALALRLASENKGVGTPAVAVPAGIANGIGGVLPTAPADGAPALPGLPAMAGAAPMPAAVAPSAWLAGAAGANVVPGALRAASTAGPGAVPLAGLDAAATDADAASLEGLLATLDALLPAAPAKPAPNAAAAPLAPPAAAAVPASPVAPPLPAPVIAVADGVMAPVDGFDDAARQAGAGELSGLPSAAPNGNPLAAGAAPFTLQLGTVSSFAAAAPRADGAQPPIQAPFDSPQWGNELATRVVSLAREQISEAEIRVTPEELGPIEVKLRFDGDRVHAQFGAISPEAREALTANLHRLREMFAGEGLNLGQAFVGQQGQDAARRFDGQATRGNGSGGEGDDELAAVAPRIAGAARRGLLDEFA